MAMLAEPRQRKRYNLVPRGKALYEDDSRFGTKMLEKMGWSKGKGLGANEDGSQDFVRVRYKNDIQGLGYEQRDDQWTEHENSFSCLLKSLNGEGTDGEESPVQGIAVESEDDTPRVGFGFQNEETKPEAKKSKKFKLKEKISGISLEERSKQSRARVHYKKFTKGKDLSQYSEKDLANIFGKKAVEYQDIDSKDHNSRLNESGSHNSEKEPTADKVEKQVSDTFAGVQTISTGLSVEEYFKMKMAALKRRSGQANNENVNSQQEEDTVGNTGNEETSRTKKKKKRDPEIETPISNVSTSNYQNLSEEPEERVTENFNIQQEGDIVRNTGNEETSRTKKKKKKRDQELETPISNVSTNNYQYLPEEPEERVTENVNIQQEGDIVRNTDNEEISRAKKKKKKRDPEIETAISNVSTNNYQDLPEEPEERAIENVNIQQEGDIVRNTGNEETSRTKKKKKKREQEIETPIGNVSTNNYQELPEEPVGKVNAIMADQNTEKKKGKKKKSKDVAVEEESQGEFIQEKDDIDNVPKELKKTKKRKHSDCLPATDKDDEEPSTKKYNKIPADNVNVIADDEICTEKPINNSKKNKKNKKDVSHPKELVALRNIKNLSFQELKDSFMFFNTYRLSSFCAEKFRNIDLKFFPSSTLSEIVGYGLSEDIQLCVKISKSDEQRITNLWESTLSKYGDLARPKKTYQQYVRQTRIAQKTKQKRPKLNVKTWKRKNAFAII